LPEQWKDELQRFIPKARVHIVSKRNPYPVADSKGRWPDVLIISYSKLAYWEDVIVEHCKTVVWDEAQELRKDDSQKHKAARHIADAMQYRFGLTGTPVYNFGGEFYNVMRCIKPDALGTFPEFSREWCNGVGQSMKPRLQDAKAFGTFLREHHLMIRRTRADVGRELPGLTKVTHFVNPDAEEFKKSDDRARELARLILQSGTRTEKFLAAGQFDALMRQTTGISKAIPVAAFVEMLNQSGEPVVLFGWHRSVYDIWLTQLKDYKPALYTG
jgi:SNF2 family DNA or RNA helicase